MWGWGGYGHDTSNFTCIKNIQNVSEQMLKDFYFHETITLVEENQQFDIMLKHRLTTAQNTQRSKNMFNTFIKHLCDN